MQLNFEIIFQFIYFLFFERHTTTLRTGNGRKTSIREHAYSTQTLKCSSCETRCTVHTFSAGSRLDSDMCNTRAIRNNWAFQNPKSIRGKPIAAIPTWWRRLRSAAQHLPLAALCPAGLAHSAMYNVHSPQHSHSTCKQQPSKTDPSNAAADSHSEITTTHVEISTHIYTGMLSTFINTESK